MAAKDKRDPTAAEDEINLLELAGTLWAGRRWILTAMAASLVLAGLVVLASQPVYQANALIQLETRSGASSPIPTGMQELLGAAGAGGASPTETEIEILKSRKVIGQAVQDLNLQAQAGLEPLPLIGLLPQRLGLPDPLWGLLAGYRWGNESIHLSELEVPEDWLDKPIRVTITGPDSFRAVFPDGESREGKVRERVTLPGSGLSLMVAEMQGQVGRSFSITREALQDTVKEVQKVFTAAGTSRNSSILRLTYRDPDPKQAERVLDAITRSYVEQNVARSAAEAENSIGFIEQQLPEALAAVDKAQQALNAYRQKQNSVDVDFETRSLLERATELEGELNKLTLQEEEIKKRYTVNHPTYELLLENRKTIEAQLSRLRGETANLPETQKEIFNLTRDLDVAQQVYVQLLNRAQELKVIRASTVGSVRVIDTAYSDGIPISPRIALIVIMCLVMGTLLGIVAVLIRRMLRKGVHGAQEIEQLGLPVFATVDLSPAVPAQTKGNTLPILALSNPEDEVVEALRSLRTSLHFGMLDARTNTVMLTSAAPGAGKSFTAINLAVVAAQAGQKVCLIDADLRRGYLRRYLGREKGTPGLSEYLAQEKTLDEVMIPGPVSGLSVILTGRYPPNPSELLMRPGFENLLTLLNGHFDLIILDAPPVLAVTDPVVIGRFAGASIMVFRHMETTLGEVEAVMRTFANSGLKITGAILNGYRRDEAGDSGYSYRYSYKTDH